MASLILFVTCFLLLASPVVAAETVTMRLLLRENSTYINVMFTDALFQELFLCMSTQSTASCSIYVFYRMNDAFAIRIEPSHEGVNGSLSDFFTCDYTPSHPNVVCNRLNPAVFAPNTHHTSFSLQDPCCANTCLGFVWNDFEEQLLYDNDTLQICDGNCTQCVTKPELMSTTFLNETRPGPISTNSMTKAASYDRSTSLIVSIVVAAIIAVDIIVVIIFILYKKCRSRNSGEIKIIDKNSTINTDSFRTLSSDLPVEYVNTDQSRDYSGLDFANGVASDQHFYARMEPTHKLRCNDEHENIYEDPDLKAAEVTNADPYNSETANKKGDDRTYSTIGDSYVILEDVIDGNAEINRRPTKRCSTAEQTYIDLNDESTDTYIRAYTEIDGSNRSNDSKSCDTPVYANTEPCVLEVSQPLGVEQDSEYTNVPRKITIRM